MPHRPERTSSTSAAAAPAPAYNGHLATSPGARGSIIRAAPQSALHSNSFSGVVTPIVHSIGGIHGQKPWMSSHASGTPQMSPSLEAPKSSDSADRSMGTKHDDATIATVTTETTAEELEKREATASALLLVSTQAIRSDKNYSELSNDSEGAPSSEGVETAAMPLKKRKKHLDFLRRNQTTTVMDKEPCHVSPVSHASVGNNSVEGRTVSREEISPERPARLGHGAQRSNSYDSKESPVRSSRLSTQPLLNSSKINNMNDITPLSHVVVPHFPSVLHQVLSDTEYSGSVVQWLPNGEAWKVLRWDALRRQVLPKYFADLRDENGSGSGTIDAFLWHLTAWGFEEVKDGTAVGAYRHDLFIRGAQKLCSKMRFTAVPSDEDKNSNGPKTVSPARVRSTECHRSMLQVPSLTGTPRLDGDSGPNKRARYGEKHANDCSKAGLQRESSPGSLNWPHRPQHSAMMLGSYRNDDPYAESTAWRHYYGESAYPGMRSVLGHYRGYETRYHAGKVGSETLTAQSSTMYAPPQVRSGRGAMRVISNRTASTSSPTTTPVVRSSFPVSNRGKGSRRMSACRTSVPSVEVSKQSETSSEADKGVSLAEAQRIGSNLQGIAVAISRKTKRKLPLNRKTEQDAKSSA